MRILAVSDEESTYLWEHDAAKKLQDFDLILSCGDLKAEYLSFLVTMAKCPVLYVHGNHDGHYAHRPPEGCDCIEDKLVVYNGLRILGLGGSMRYHPGPHQYTEKQMRKRVKRLRLRLFFTRGIDILLTHAPAYQLGDDTDLAHTGFETFLHVIDKYKPKVMAHGHVHQSYRYDFQREREHKGTRIINAYGHHYIEL